MSLSLALWSLLFCFSFSFEKLINFISKITNLLLIGIFLVTMYFFFLIIFAISMIWYLKNILSIKEKLCMRRYIPSILFISIFLCFVYILMGFFYQFLCVGIESLICIGDFLRIC